MNFFVLFIVMAVVLGSGAMLAPVWATREPRVGTSAAFCLALISGGAVFWAYAFGWDTLVIDYLLFGLMSFVVLGGTLSSAQARAEASGDEDFHEDDQHWISRADLLFMSVIGLICAIPLFVLVFPISIGSLNNFIPHIDSPRITLAARDYGTFYLPATETGKMTLYSAPAFHAVAAYLSDQLNLPIPTVYLGFGAALVWLCIWAMYDLGAEIRDVRLGRAMALATLLTGGVIVLQWASYYPQLMALLFTIAFMTYALRYSRQHNWLDSVAAGLMLGAVLFASPMLFGIVIGIYYLWLVWGFIQSRIAPRKQAPPANAKLKLFGQWIGIALVTAIATAPFLPHVQRIVLYYIVHVDNEFLILWTACIIPVSMITGYVCLRLYDLRPQRQTRKFKMAALTAGMVLNVVLWGVLLPIGIVARDYVKINDVFAGQSRDYLITFQWIEDNLSDDIDIGVVLDGHQSYWLSVFVPYETFVRSYDSSLNWFLLFNSPPDYIILAYDIREGYVGESYSYDNFELVFQSGDARVYRIVNNEE